jgi:hypothetical protein
MKIMTHTAESIKDILDRVSINREELDRVLKDRLDFGFDSIYFRYSEAIEELSWFKEQEAHRKGRDFNRKSWSESKRQHFYMCLEQLLHAHEPEDM